MEKISLLIGFHNHQPIGNPKSIFQKAYELAYEPTLKLFYKFPNIKLTLHNTGILYEFYESEHPEYINLVKEMVEREQLEIITGGYYEPILPVIPEHDRITQVKKLSNYIQKKFKLEARGIWLAERIWQSDLIKTLSSLDIKYTILDNYHFLCAGVVEDEFTDYYITEEGGLTLNIFPISQTLRYYIPFETVEKTISYIKKFKDGEKMLVAFDDGEKFGLWPETHKHVHQNGWLENFLKEIDNNKDSITTMTFSEFMSLKPPKSRIYLPEASYFELSTWALPQNISEEFEEITKTISPEIKKYMRGSIWKNFLVKYPESNDMHKKMLYVSQKVKKNKKGEDNKIISKAEESLLKSQCNCAYWHGIFGGLYLPHLRNAIYYHLIESEFYLDELKETRSKIITIDINKDGKDEILYESKKQNLYFIPHYGGSLYEWDIKSKRVNLLNTLTRRKEAYHRKISQQFEQQKEEAIPLPEIIKSKEENIEKYLYYDWYKRNSLLDHFLHPHTTQNDFMKCQYGEQGDFILSEYTPTVTRNTITLFREGIVWQGENPIKTYVEKSLTPTDKGISIFYKIKNTTDIQAHYIFAPEFNFLLTDHEMITIHSNEWEYRGEPLNFKIKTKEAIEFWITPIYTVSISEAGFERNYQGTSILPIFKFNLSKNEIKKIKIEIVTHT